MEYQYDDIEGEFDMVRDIKCPYCGEVESIGLGDYEVDVSSYERRMGAETIRTFEIEECTCKKCNKTFKISGWISEYPEGAYNSEDIDVEKIE